MISSGGVGVICDFGCARMIRDSLSIAKVSTTLKGTRTHLAPEVLDPEGDDIENISSAECELKPLFSKESDVWAFGMTIFVSTHVGLVPVCLSCNLK